MTKTRNPYQETTPGSTKERPYFYFIRNAKQRLKRIDTLYDDIAGLTDDEGLAKQLRYQLDIDVPPSKSRDKYLIQLRRKMNLVQRRINLILDEAEEVNEIVEEADKLANKPINTKAQVNTSEFRGVGYAEDKNLWRARLSLPNGEVLQQWCKTEMEAAECYDKFVKENFSGYEKIKRLNFYDGPEPEVPFRPTAHQKRKIIRWELSKDQIREVNERGSQFLRKSEADELIEKHDINLEAYKGEL